MRDMYKIADSVKINSYYDMSAIDLLGLMNEAKTGDGDKIYLALVTAFRYGYALGGRAKKKELLG